MPDADRAVYTYIDYGREVTTVTIPTWVHSEVNRVQYFNEFAALLSAINGVTLGANVSEKAIIEDTHDYVLPALPVVQREKKWLVRYSDSDGFKHTAELPCHDDTDATLWLPNEDKADVSAAAWVTFIAAFEAICRRGSGNTLTVTVDEIISVNRNI